MRRPSRALSALLPLFLLFVAAPLVLFAIAPPAQADDSIALSGSASSSASVPKPPKPPSSASGASSFPHPLPHPSGSSSARFH